MLDAYKDEITDEERAIQMGEAQPPAPDADKPEQKEEKGPDPKAEPEGKETPEGEKPEAEKKPEPTPEEKAAAEEIGLQVVTDDKGRQYIVDEDGARIPPARFSKIYRAAKEGEQARQKLDHFKTLPPEQFYNLYPDERPEGYTPPGQKEAPAAAPPPEDLGSMIVRQDGGPYDGMTLRDVYAVDPVFATNLQTEHVYQQRRRAEHQSGEQARIKQEAQREIETFAGGLSKELYEKEAPALSEAEQGEIAGTIKQVLDWMNKTHRGGGNIEDAYFLMNKEGLLKKVSDKAAMNALRSIQDRKGPPSIDTGAGGNVTPTGFEAVEKMTADQLEKHIDGMTDADMGKFLREAPKSIRAKLPSAPWK